ncbi:MAG: phenylalanine--tRNA ligase subunit beta [Chloroflexi bacterium]|nr:phenylalanine--tRNA ligase subunit beta [Chloroflexota bacterium]
MRISLAWLREYVDLVAPHEELADRLTLAGLEVTAIETVGAAWERVNVGQVVEVQPHPNADRLSLVTVDLGDRRPTVVCGAPNVARGQKVAFASVGARLIDGHTGQPATLKPAKIRGVVSEGMVCSEKELGISGNHEQILVLPADAPLGAGLAEYLGDTVLTVEVSPNRPDWLCMLGVAREVAALTGQVAHEPDLAYEAGDIPVAEKISVQILDPELCGRYCAGVVTGVRIGPSPGWMQRRLEAAGMRPINNVVDVTNYVMLEYGQPLHAFDYERIEGRKIVVRRAREGEALASLDGVQRTLSCNTLVIADERRPVAIAGVMGGLLSEVSGNTTAILLESANFDHASIHRTSLALNLRSEASLRFEKGLPPELAAPALRRAMRLIVELAGGKAASGIVDAYPGERKRPPVTLALRDVSRLLGMDVPAEKCRGVLESLGFAIEGASPAELTAGVPYWRTDVSQGADLVEEIARITGYDQIPTTAIAAPIPQYETSAMLLLKERLRDILVACGLQEVITYSLVSKEAHRKATPDPGQPGPEPMRIANPMSRELEYLRTSLRPRLLATVAQNQRHAPGVRLFEIGKAYLPRKSDLPEEVETLAAVLAGLKQEPSWRTGVQETDFFDAKGIAEAVLRRLGAEATFVPGVDPGLRPGRCADILAGGEKVGVVGEVHPRVVENFEAQGPVYLFELGLEALARHVLPGVEYRPLPRFPAVVRDLALVVDLGVRFQDVAEAVRSFPLVSRVVLFDVYQGEQVPAGKKSLAFRVVYQSPEHTLTDEDVLAVQGQMLAALGARLGAVLRG